MVATRASVLEVLATVMDPEVPVLSVVELGIVRDVDINPDTQEVIVTVTPTYSGCPAIQIIEDDILSVLAAAGIPNARVKSVLAPAWTTDWIDDAAKSKMKAYGIAPPEAAEQGGLIQLVRASATPSCPYCDSPETEIRSEFGTTACKSVCWCRNCRQPFEKFKAI